MKYKISYKMGGGEVCTEICELLPTYSLERALEKCEIEWFKVELYVK